MGKSWLAVGRTSQVNAVTWREGSSDWTRTSNPASQHRGLCLLVGMVETWR
jgi:hypothetical protein